MNADALHDLTFDDPDYRDHFVLTARDDVYGVEEFVERLAMRQPGWLTRVSMGLSGAAELRRGVVDALDGGALGNWHVIDRTDTSITFAEDMRIMRYRLAFKIDSPNQVSARTDVVQQTGWFGPIYWLLATPLHKRFLQLLLRRAGGEGSVVSQKSLETL
ncbi:MAG: DUF2867 domain-containing protein [Ilumatobacter sp.]